jgi:hypothetical protein
MRLPVVAASILCLFLPTSTRAEGPIAGSDLGSNAALKYWAGFALLPALDQNQERILEEWHKVPFDSVTLKLIEESESSRSYLHRGVKVARCDWSLDYDEGIGLLLPHLSKALTLTRLTALHARHEFEQGHWQAGWDDVTAMLKLARHIESTPIMIANLVGYRIESTSIEAAAPWLPESKGAIVANASAVLESLPAGVTLQQLVMVEKQIGPVWMIRELKQAEQRKAGSWQVVWSSVLSHTGSESENPLRNLERSAKTLEQALRMLEDQLPLSDQLAKISILPWKEFDVQYPEFVTKMTTPNSLAGFLLPNLGKFVAAQRRHDAQVALFKGALAVIQGGPDKLKEIKDPFGDGPFEYRATATGFELKSKLLFKDQPVTLEIGRRAK